MLHYTYVFQMGQYGQDARRR